MTLRKPGILVLAYTRPRLLEMVLESLSRQEALDTTHVWIDGNSGRMDLSTLTGECARIAGQYAVAEIRAHRGHLGTAKLMLDGLRDMAAEYERLIVLEDDCFPVRDAVTLFADGLDAVADRPDVYSVYGHPFLTPSEGRSITRFQGWGWATTRDKLTPVLGEAREQFALSERAYLDANRRDLTPDIVARLDVTPGRDVCTVLRSFFSWDSCTALVTARRGLVHVPTSRRAVFNCGLGADGGHFPETEIERFRRPPFNMIRPDEAWAHF